MINSKTFRNVYYNSILLAVCQELFKKSAKIIPGEEAGDLLYSEEPKGGHVEDAGKDGYLVIGNKPRPDFDTAYRVPLHCYALYLHPRREVAL